MLTHLLATDPTTPAGVLTYLAARENTAADTLALAVHPNLPADAEQHMFSVPDDALHAALTHPGLSPARRRQYINAAPGIAGNVATYDDLTPDELTYLHATRPSEQLRAALTLNTRTPPHLAQALAADLYRAGSRADVRAADILALRHSFRASTREGRAAARTPDPLATYAQHLLTPHGERPSGQAHRDQVAQTTKGVWAQTIIAFPHPLITAAALEVADDPATPNPVVVGICWAVAKSTRALPDHRYRAAQRLPLTAVHIAATAPDHILGALIPLAPRFYGWDNPHATDVTLRAILDHAVAHPEARPPSQIPAALILHPGASEQLRTDVLDAGGHLAKPLAPLVHHLNTYGTVLEAPMPALLAAERDTTHTHHWARVAWAQARTEPITVSDAQALLTLEAGTFPGSLRELLHAARTITT